MSGTSWTPEDAERHLGALELFGMRFGLDRMRRLLTVLGSPQESFASIHVVGTNGKTSVTRMTAAILERHGHRTGAYISPHLIGYEERIRIRERDLDRASFGAAVERAAHAAALVDRTAAPGDRVTQFELLTAAAFSELAAAEVGVAVVEAGLGGRFDATNVLSSSVQVLTGIGLEHTRWLGPTVDLIAREKLAVVRDGGTLVIGALDAEVREEARRTAEAHGARLVEADLEAAGGGLLPAGYPRRNFALAMAAAEAFHGPLDAAAVRAAAEHIEIPGRLQVVGHDPLTVLDGAHNPAGIAALVEALDGVVPPGAPLVAMLSVLEDKDASGMLSALAPACDAMVLTASVNPRALTPATLASLLEQQQGPPHEIIPDPHRAFARARELAGRRGVAVATGSIYLVADLLRPPGRRAATL
jgi:dihydrofolate synthase / folylpolyglutamate synthase